LASDLFEWNENVSSFREKIRQDVDQALNDIKGKFDVNPSRKYSLNFDEIILFADNKVDLLIKEINHYCTWKFDHVNECFLFHVSGGKSFIHYDEIEDIAQHLKNLIFRLIDKRIDMGGEKITSLSNEDWKFFREIIHEDGLTFEKNHEQIHQIQYSSLDDIEWLFINNIPDGSLKQRDLLMNYSEKQIEIFHGSQQNVCSILKFNHMIPFNAIDFFNENQNAYRNSNHLFTQDWNAAWYEHQMKLEGIAKNFQSIVDSLTPCFWSPVLINAFFIALASEIVYLDDKDINLKKWLLKSLSDYKDIELYRDESRYELGKSLVETFKAFTLTIPCKHRFGNDIFNPFYNANILDFVKAIYEHAEEGDPQILRRFADDLETNESKEVVSFRNLLCYQERRYKEFSSNFDRVSLKGKNDPNPLMWKIR
jgi:hypothetical protein